MSSLFGLQHELLQRGFTKSIIIKNVINDSILHHSTILQKFDSQKEFDDLHIQICMQLINGFKSYDLNNVSYGRCAKIVNIYLKTSIVIGNVNSNPKVNFIHPPIDRILLKNLISKLPESNFEMKNWTHLEKDDYFSIINKIKALELKGLWQIEKYWEI